ncbi:CGL68 [Auxenochlorella protothecoides x Auxenochlorella symbiontica]|uniref:Putative membrane protein YuiD n=1 Tax=Auxenochlorella protothecoides TaxID=3075 RepID=A0A087SC97_AUXPR|nr:putative membrane protein YuiD [Auxenochlorella protothecoides]KFM23351.1 putative membrane protein YuiD [Auxenochlorella protothecoides]
MRWLEEAPDAESLVTEHVGLMGVFFNGAFVAAFLGFFFAQAAKMFTHYYSERKWELERLWGSGGMPSSHTSCVMGLTSAVGVLQGTSSSYFAMCVVFSLVVMYDATGVRLHAGKQASVLNMIIMELPPDHPVASNVEQLKDQLGHTPLQVAVGAVVGVVTGYITGILYR